MPPAGARADTRTSFRILGALSLCHLLNDMMQSLLPAIYPMLKLNLGLSFSQIGLITLTNQVTASLLQPIVGHYNDRRSYPYALSMGMAFSFAGMLLLWRVGNWFRNHRLAASSAHLDVARHSPLSRKTLVVLAMLMMLIFSKYVYLASLGSYYTFYLITRFHVSMQSAQVHLFLF